MVGELAGDQWNEGDVSDSVVRRVALPDAFFAADGLFQTFLTVLDEFGAFPAVIQRELDRYLPFLATTKVLMAAVRNGVGREAAHEAIKEHAVAVALACAQGQASNDVFERLAADPRLGPRPGRPRRPGRRADRVHRARRSTRSRPSIRRVARGRGAGTPRPRRTRPARSSEGVACRSRSTPRYSRSSRSDGPLVRLELRQVGRRGRLRACRAMTAPARLAPRPRS